MAGVQVHRWLGSGPITPMASGVAFRQDRRRYAGTRLLGGSGQGWLELLADLTVVVED